MSSKIIFETKSVDKPCFYEMEVKIKLLSTLIKCKLTHFWFFSTLALCTTRIYFNALSFNHLGHDM